MREHDRAASAPVFVVDRGAVFGGESAHVAFALFGLLVMAARGLGGECGGAGERDPRSEAGTADEEVAAGGAKSDQGRGVGVRHSEVSVG